MRSARYLPIPGRFRVVDSLTPTSLFLDFPGIQVAPLGLWVPGSSPHPPHYSQNTGRSGRLVSHSLPRPFPSQELWRWVEILNQVQERPRRAKALCAASEPPCACGARGPLGQRALTLLDPTSSPQEPSSGEQRRLDRARSLEPQRAAKYTSKEQENAGYWDPSPERPSWTSDHAAPSLT